MDGDLFQLGGCWWSSPGHHFLNLIDGRGPWKHGLSIEHLSNEAAQCPYIDRLAIVLASEQQFGSPVPPCGDIISHDNSFLIIGLLHESNQAKITQFGVTIFVDEDVGRLQVAMDQAGIMQEIDGFGDLIDDVLLVALLQVGALAVLANQRMEINVHMLKDQVDVLIVLGANGLLQGDDITVLELPKEHDLPVGSLRISGVRKGIEVFLQRLDHLRLAVDDLPDVPVGATADLLDDLIALQDVRFYLIGHRTIIYYTNNGTSDCNISHQSSPSIKKASLEDHRVDLVGLDVYLALGLA